MLREYYNSEENRCKFTKYVQFILCHIRANRCGSLYDDMTSVPYSLLGILDAMIKRERQSIAINICVDSKTALSLVHFVKDTALNTVHFMRTIALNAVHLNGYVVKDDIETGYGNIIPLWMFGMLY